MNLDRSVNFGACLVAAALITGCAHDIRTSTAHRSIRLGPDQGPSGSVEFSAPHADTAVQIYRFDEKGVPHNLSAVGLKAGDRYDFDRYGVLAAERLTVTTSPGTQQFRIEDEGPVLEVPVVEGKVTPVAIKYNLIEGTPHFVLYSAEVRVQPPLDEPDKK